MTDILKTDAVEAEFLTGTADIHEAARILAALGPREIVLTHKDGLLVLADGSYHEARLPPGRAARPQRPRRHLRRLVRLASGSRRNPPKRRAGPRRSPASSSRPRVRSGAAARTSNG